MSEKSYSSPPNFRAQKLCFEPDRIVVRNTVWNYLFFGFFFLVGLAATVIFFYDMKEWGDFVLALLVGGVMALVGGIGLISLVRRRYPEIDTLNGVFYPDGRHAEQDRAIPLKEFEKFRLSSDVVHACKSHYDAFCLTMRFRTGEEFTILRHGSFGSFMRDAEALSERLNRPLDAEAFRKKHADKQHRGSWTLLVFGILWTGMAAAMLSFALLMGACDMFIFVLLGTFVASGLVMIVLGVRGVRARRRV